MTKEVRQFPYRIYPPKSRSLLLKRAILKYLMNWLKVLVLTQCSPNPSKRLESALRCVSNVCPVEQSRS